MATQQNLASSSAVKGGESSSNGHNSVRDLVDSFETGWTNEKHSTYLDSIEASFIKKMYGSEYCALDLCSASVYGKRKLSTAYDGNFISLEVSDCNFKDEANVQKGPQNTLLEAPQNSEVHVNLKKAKGVDSGCRSLEDQVVPLSAITNEAGNYNYPYKVHGFSGYVHQHCNGSINFPSWKKPCTTSLKHKQLSGGDSCTVGKNDCFDKGRGCDV